MLTENNIRAAKPTSKKYKLHDEKGLYLLVMPNVSKCWRYDYRYKGKRKTIGLMVYFDVSLSYKQIKLIYE